MFKLNITSGYLHKEDHGGDNTESFERADAADLAAKRSGKRMQFCEHCFGKTRNTLPLEQGESSIELAKATLPEGDDQDTERLRARLRETTVNADDAVPAGRQDPLTPQQPQRTLQTDRP